MRGNTTVVAQQEAMQQPAGKLGGDRALKGGGVGNGIGKKLATVAYTTIN
jgi:hypothetical protein